LIAGLQSGSLKPSSAPEVQAQLLLTRMAIIPPRIGVSPGEQDTFDKEEETKLKAAMTLLLVARDAQGNILSAAQRAWNVRIPSKERGNFEKTTVTVHSQIPLAELQTISIDAILQLPGNVLSGPRRRFKFLIPKSLPLV